MTLQIAELFFRKSSEHSRNEKLEVFQKFSQPSLNSLVASANRPLLSYLDGVYRGAKESFLLGATVAKNSFNSLSVVNLTVNLFPLVFMPVQLQVSWAVLLGLAQGIWPTPLVT